MARRIVDIFAWLKADDTGFEADVVKKAQKAGDAAGTTLGARIASGISRGATQIGSELAKIGQGLTRTGRALTTNLTLPILAAGGAATHFALDFDTKLRQIVALSDVTQDEIAGIRAEILKLGPEVGKSPQELADAFYFLASSGLSAKDAMAALKIAAKASASGMGLTSDIAKVLASTINAYGKENITAARAGDVLTAAVKDGSAEASDFAGALGRVVPVAASLGVSFDQVSAALSGMTLVGISTDEATTSLVQIFSALLKTTPQAEDAMNALGLSSAGLREEIRDKGLLATLRTLDQAFGSNETAASAVFGNIRALRGITALLSLDESQLNKVFADTKGALGDLQGAYDDTEGPQRQLDKALADLQVTAIEFGADTLPMVVDVVKQIAAGARELAKWWRSLDAGTRKTIVQWLAWLAIAGPVLTIIGKLASGLGAVFKVIGFLAGSRGIPALASAAGRARLAMLGWVGVVLAIGVALKEGGDALHDFIFEATHGKKAAAALKEITDTTGSKMFAIAFINAGGTLEGFNKVLEKTGGDGEAAMHAIEQAAGDVGRALFQLSLDADPVKVFPGWGTRDPTKIEAALDAARKSGEQLPADLSASLVDGQFEVQKAAETMVDPIDKAMDDAKQKVADAAVELIHTLASTLSSNPKELQDAAKAMWEEILHPFPDIKRRGEIEAILASKKIADGLHSKDSQVRADTAEFVKGLLAQYELMAPGALAAGELVHPALQKGLDRNLGALTLYLETVTGKIVNQFDLADELERMGYKALADYIRGIATQRQNAIDTAQGIRIRVAKEMSLNLYDAGRTASQTWVGGFVSTGVAAIDRWLNTVKVRLIGLSPPPEGPLKDLDVGAERAAGSWVSRFVATLRGGTPSIGAALGQIAGAMAMQPMGLAGASVPSASGRGGGIAGAVSSSSIVNLGGITINAGSDVSPEAARRFAQQIHDELATTLQEQRGRFPKRPRVALG